LTVEQKRPASLIIEKIAFWLWKPENSLPCAVYPITVIIELRQDVPFYCGLCIDFRSKFFDIKKILD